MKFEAPGFRQMIENGKRFKRLVGHAVTMDDAPDWCSSPEEKYAWAAGFHSAVLSLDDAKLIRKR